MSNVVDVNFSERDMSLPIQFDELGKEGTPGVSPTVEVTAIEGGHRVTVTDVGGEKAFDVTNGKNGEPGYTPQKDVDYFDGKDGTSVTHEWNGTKLSVTSASGTSEADLQGRQGDQGPPGIYLGSGNMPDGYFVQLDPEGEADGSFEDLVESVAAAIPGGGGGIAKESDPTVQSWAKAEIPAAVGQYFRVKAVDDSGKVTEVEAVDAPSGGGDAADEYVVILNKTLEAAVANTDEWGGESHMYEHRHFWTTDANGNPIDADAFYIQIHIPKQTENIVSSGELQVRVGQKNPTGWSAWVGTTTNGTYQPYIGYGQAVPASGNEAFYVFQYDLRSKTATAQQASNKPVGGASNYYAQKAETIAAFSRYVDKMDFTHWIGFQIDLISGSLPAGTEIFAYARKRNPNKVGVIPKWGV